LKGDIILVDIVRKTGFVSTSKERRTHIHRYDKKLQLPPYHVTRISNVLSKIERLIWKHYFIYMTTPPVVESMSLNHDDYGLYCSEVGSFRFRDFRL